MAPVVPRTRTRRGAVAALLLVCATGACTARTDPSVLSADPPTAAAAPGSTQELRPPAVPVAVLPDQAPGPTSVAVSRALFAQARVVVVARSDDAPGLQEAAGRAQQYAAPLLLQDPAVPPAPGPDPALAAEVERLRPATVLLVGTARDLTALPHSTTGSGGQPARRGAAGLTVLVPAATPATPATTAATATARAAGALVVPVRGDDPRADPSAIVALASAPAAVLAVGQAFGPVDRLTARLAVARTGRQLPGGGQVLFPGRRLVALYGTPGCPSLGVLGEQGLDAAVERARQVAAPYGPLSDVPVVPAFEVIATVASGAPGSDGDYSNERAVADLLPWVERAGSEGLYVVLDLQPGRTDFLTQAQAYAPLLRLPHVGLALDPEWRLGPDQVPLQQIGGVGIDEVNRVVTWLADLTASGHLPQKLLVLHQFRPSMLRGESRLDTSRDELALLVHMDGQGAPALKDESWAAVTSGAPPGVSFGWKDFYDEDTPVLTPAQTLARRPAPVMVTYQ